MAVEITKVLTNFIKDDDIQFCREAIEPEQPKPSVKTEAKDKCEEIQATIAKINGDIEVQKAIEQSKADTTKSIMNDIYQLVDIKNYQSNPYTTINNNYRTL